MKTEVPMTDGARQALAMIRRAGWCRDVRPVVWLAQGVQAATVASGITSAAGPLTATHILNAAQYHKRGGIDSFIAEMRACGNEAGATWADLVKLHLPAWWHPAPPGFSQPFPHKFLRYCTPLCRRIDVDQSTREEPNHA